MVHVEVETLSGTDHPEGVNELPGQGVPLLGEEGWLRHQENAAKPPLKGADGVVTHTPCF